MSFPHTNQQVLQQSGMSQANDNLQAARRRLYDVMGERNAAMRTWSELKAQVMRQRPRADSELAQRFEKAREELRRIEKVMGEANLAVVKCINEHAAASARLTRDLL